MSTDNLKTTEGLLQYLLVLELSRRGLPQGQIAKRLHISINTVNEMLKGMPRADSGKAK